MPIRRWPGPGRSGPWPTPPCWSARPTPGGRRPRNWLGRPARSFELGGPGGELRRGMAVGERGVVEGDVGNLFDPQRLCRPGRDMGDHRGHRPLHRGQDGGEARVDAVAHALVSDTMLYRSRSGDVTYQPVDVGGGDRPVHGRSCGAGDRDSQRAHSHQRATAQGGPGSPRQGHDHGGTGDSGQLDSVGGHRGYPATGAGNWPSW